MRWVTGSCLIAVAALTACSPSGETTTPTNGELPAGPVAKIDKVEAAAIPPEIAPLAKATIPGMKIAEAERKERDGRVYYDVEGTRPDGSEVELDVLVEDGKYRVVEIQRDIPWASAPPEAVAAARAAGLRFAPVRVIESRETEDGRIIYELFAPNKPAEPAMEVKMKDGKAAVLTERSVY